MKPFLTTLFSAMSLVIIVNACAPKEAPQTDEDIVAIATKAYTYGLPILLMDYTKKKATNVSTPNAFGEAPVNQFGHFRTSPDHTFTAVVKPNVDTYYSTAWLDLKAEPLVLSVPATDRYYMLPMLDAWSNVFAAPGTRTTGTSAQDFLIVGPNYTGQAPMGITLLQSPTNMVWIVGRTQVNSLQDGQDVVHAIQDEFKLVPLSAWGKAYTQPQGSVTEDYKNLIPAFAVEELSTTDFFNQLAALMEDNPALPGDEQLLKEMASIGIEPGKPFNTNSFSQELLEKLNKIPQTVIAALIAANTNTDPSTLINGWSASYQLDAMGQYGQDYKFRALVSFIGLGANLRKDAVYPNATLDSDGNLLNAAHNYVIHFEKDQIPPVKAFWSITMYNAQNFLVGNPINRYALGDRDPLHYNADGSLDIYIQTKNPGAEKESNWLPTPQEGTFELTLRLYWPKKDVLNGTWKPVPIIKVE